jgi:porin
MNPRHGSRSASQMASVRGRRPRWLWTLACGALALAGGSSALATKAWSQAIHSDNPAPSGQTYLTGDWGGLRSYLERNGITLTLTDTTDLLANVSGGIKTGAVGIGALQPQLDLDLQKLAGWQGGLVHVHGLVTYGPLFSANYLGNILAVSNIEAGPMARLYAFWYEQNGSNDLWSIRVGLMLADSQFLQSKTAANFINNGISWPDFLAANLPASGPAYPLPAPGVRVRVKPRDDMQLQAAVFSGDPSGGDGSNQPAPLPTGTVLSFSGGAFFIAEASYLPNQGKDAGGLPGAYRIGAWYHTSARFADQRFDDNGLSLANPQSTGIPLEHVGDGGVYGVIDQMLYRVPGTEDQGLSGFFRAGGVPQDRNLINFYADGGLLYKGLVPHRPDDKIGIATAFARVGDNARGLDADIGFFSGNPFYPVRSSEAVIELMYQAQLKPWWMLQPDLQYVINPGGGVLNSDGSLRRNALVVGVRTLLSF